MISYFREKVTGQIVDKDTAEFGYSPRAFTALRVRTKDGNEQTFVVRDSFAKNVKIDEDFSWTNWKGPLRFLNQLR